MAILTPEQLQAIRTRAETATEGPWDWDSFGFLGAMRTERQHRFFLCDYRDNFPRGEDRKFIAAARSDVPALLTHIDALTPRWRDGVPPPGWCWREITGDPEPSMVFVADNGDYTRVPTNESRRGVYQPWGPNRWAPVPMPAPEISKETS